MARFTGLRLSPERIKQLARRWNAIRDIALDVGYTNDGILEVIRQLESGREPRGGKRDRAGRKPRHWPTATGFEDERGRVQGHDLFDLEFRLVTEAALFPGLRGRKAVFVHLMQRLEAAQPLGKVRPTWAAYLHALTNPPAGARAAAAQRARERRAASRLRCGIHPCTMRALMTSRTG